jgi:small subunit ribosomal protein S11
MNLLTIPNKLKYNYFIKRKKKPKILKTKIVYIKGFLNLTYTLNNTLMVYTDLTGKTLYSYSCGRLPNVKKSNRSNYYNILNAINKFSSFLYKKNIKHIYLKLNGIGLTRKTLIKSIKKSKLKIYKIYNLTSKPHNGCKPKKYRRK